VPGAERHACREQIAERKTVNICRYGTYCILLRCTLLLLAHRVISRQRRR
jgi:hypothetical protein